MQTLPSQGSSNLLYSMAGIAVAAVVWLAMSVFYEPQMRDDKGDCSVLQWSLAVETVDYVT